MERTNSRNSHLFAALGGALVIIGLLALIIDSWDQFTPLGRILTAVIPLVLLYILVGVAFQKEASRPVARYALVTASISLPLVLGVVLYQSGVFTEVNGALVTCVALASALNSGLIEFLYGDDYHTPLTLISLIIAALGLISWLSLDITGASTVLLLTGALMLAIGVLQGMDSRNKGTGAWHTTGAVLFIGSLCILPLGLTKDIIDVELRGTLISLAYVGCGVVTLLIAVLYSRLWQQQKSMRYFYDIRTVYERVAALFLIVPAASLTLSSNFAGTFLILVGASLIGIGISTKVRVSWYRVLGIAGIAVAIIRLIALGIQSLTAIWPIVLVGVGLLLFIAAIFGAHKASEWNQSLFVMPTTSWEKLGEMIEAPHPFQKPTNNDLSGWFWFILIIIILWALSSL